MAWGPQDEPDRTCAGGEDGTHEMASRSRPTISDVARAVGVSTAAVSYALNDRGGVSEATRARIRRAADELGWTPSSRGRSLASARAWAIGLVLRRPADLLGTDPFYPPFIAGIEDVLARQDHALVLRVVSDGDAEQGAYRWLWTSGRVDGFVVCDVRISDQRLPMLRELGVPAVAVGRPVHAVDLPWLAVDDGRGVAEATEHLVGLGHRRIAHVSGPLHYVHSLARRTAWRSTLRRHRLDRGPDEPADFTPEGGREATKRVLERDPGLTAIVYANDLMALAGISALREAGRRVPEDVSVVGFDDIPLAAHSFPPLTTVRAEPHLWGATAAREVLTLVAGGSVPPGALVVPRLVLRGTTAAPPPRHDHPHLPRPGRPRP